MEIKITGRNQEQFLQNLENILNTITVIVGRGYISTEYDIQNAERLGRYWVREGSRFVILGASNNNWVNIVEEGEDYMIFRFSTRYDKIGFPKASAVLNVILTWFDDCTELINN